MTKIFLLTLSSIVLTSCSQRLFDFTIVSTKNINLEKLSSLEKGSERTSGEDKSSIIIFIPTSTIEIDQAIDNTIEGIPGCVALLDGVVYSKFWWIPYIYGEQKFVIEATPLIDPTINTSSRFIPKYGKVCLDKQGKFKSIESIPESEYLAEKKSIQSGLKRKEVYTEENKGL
jgi:hypothetical protein